MGRQDLSNYFAQSTVDHISKKVGSSRFRKGILDYDENSVDLWGGIKISFEDREKEGLIHISLDNNIRGLKEIYEILEGYTHLPRNDPRSVKIPRKYSDILRSVEVSRENGLGLNVYFKEKNNSSGRTNNRERFFHGVYQSAVRPIMYAVGELEKIVR